MTIWYRRNTEVATKSSADPDPIKTALERFLKTSQDEASVLDLEGTLEVRLAGNTLYVPSYTRSVMDENHGATVMAIFTNTDVESKTVYFYPAADPDAKGARKLRTTESMGPALVSFGVPLRKLKLQFKESRRVVLPVHILPTPNHGTVYYISFAEVEIEARNIDKAAMAAAKQAKKSRKAKKAGPAPT
jgi:hypothetical protein